MILNLFRISCFVFRISVCNTVSAVLPQPGFPHSETAGSKLVRKLPDDIVLLQTSFLGILSQGIRRWPWCTVSSGFSFQSDRSERIHHLHFKMQNFQKNLNFQFINVQWSSLYFLKLPANRRTSLKSKSISFVILNLIQDLFVIPAKAGIYTINVHALYKSCLLSQPCLGPPCLTFISALLRSCSSRGLRPRRRNIRFGGHCHV